MNKMSPENGRIVALIDMDCFYVQVEERENPENKGKPACVVQYKKWKGGGIISVNYEARAQGVTRQMRGDEAKEKCPECILYRVPEQRGKADLTKYRDGGKEVIDVMCSFGVCVERASIDEAYIDMTSVINAMLSDSIDNSIDANKDLPNTYVVGWESSDEDPTGKQSWLKSLSERERSEQDWKLAHAAVLCEKMRAAVYEKTGFRCSAGIAPNKMLAKLACGINKPNKQTILPMASVETFFKTFPLKKVRHLGGKLGLSLREDLHCTTMEDITKIPERVLQERFDTKTGTWLYWYARGIDNEAVCSRRLPKSIGCNKNFTGNAALDSREKISHWLEELCTEIAERLEKDRETNNRVAKLLTVTVRLDGDIRPYSYTRSLPLLSYDKSKMAKACLATMSKENPCKQPNVWNPVVTCIGVSASKFLDQLGSNLKIDRFFVPKSTNPSKVENNNEPTRDTLYEDEDLRQTDSEQEEETEVATHSLEPNEEAFNSGADPVQTSASIVQEQASEVFPAAEPDNNGIILEPKQSSGTRIKTGFFASRNLKNLSVDPIPETKSVEKPVEDTKSASVEESFSIEELFPDLNNIDMETVALLPLHLQRQVMQVLEAKKGRVEYGKLVKCEKCGEQVLKEEMEEHRDFHMAFDLQEELSGLPSTSAGSAVHSKNQETAKKSSKRPLKNQKKSVKDTKRSRTIDTFFSSAN